MPTLLSIDDQTYHIARRVAWLRAHGYSVVLVPRPEAALESLLHNPVDAVLLDCDRSEMLCLASRLRQLRSQLPIIMLAPYCGGPCRECGIVTACLHVGSHSDAILRRLDALLKTRLLAA